MILSDIAHHLDFHNFSETELLKKDCTGAYSSDIMSDVLGYAKENQLWITIQHSNIAIAIASSKKLSAILLTNGIVPTTETINISNREKIPILGTNLSTFDTAGKLYNLFTTI